jgi:hypothetical protein
MFEAKQPCKKISLYSFESLFPAPLTHPPVKLTPTFLSSPEDSPPTYLSTYKAYPPPTFLSTYKILLPPLPGSLRKPIPFTCLC